AFLVMTTLGVVGTVCVLLAKEPSRPLSDDSAVSDSAADSVGRKPAFWSLLLTAPIRTPALILFMVGTAFGTMVAFVPLFVRETEIVINVGLIYTVSAIASFSIRALAGKASDQLGRGRFISAGLMFYTLAMLTLSLSTDAPTLLLAGAFQGAGSGTLIPIIAALMADRSKPNERGITFGLCLTGFDLGIALAGPVMGRIADFSSYSLVFAIAGLMTFSGLLIFVTTSSKDLPHSVQFALNGGRDVYAVQK
ncbi:MAG: MFS transporter, partial [Cyanobacteria bacterium J06650_10]